MERIAFVRWVLVAPENVFGVLVLIARMHGMAKPSAACRLVPVGRGERWAVEEAVVNN